MKFSVASVCVRELTPRELIEAMVPLGYKAVEWRLSAPDHRSRCSISHDDLPQGARTVIDLAHQRGIETLSLTSYYSANQYDQLAQLAEYASDLGVPAVRIWSGRYDRSRTFLEQIDQCRKALARLAEPARRHSVRFCVEIHNNQLAFSANWARRLLEGLPPAFFGIIFDVANLHIEGYEPYRPALEIVGEYLAWTHIKDVVWERPEQADPDREYAWQLKMAPVGQGMVNYRDFLLALKVMDLDPWLSLEEFTDRPFRQKATEAKAYFERLQEEISTDVPSQQA